MAELRLDGAALHFERYEARGSGPTLVFLHEALGCVRQWRDFPAALCAEAGLPGLAYDRLGHGGSAPMRGPRPLDYHRVEARKILPRVLDAVGVSGPVALFGHSDGATIALLYASEFPDKTAAVVAEAAHAFVDELTLSGIRSTLAEAEGGRMLRLLRRHHGEKAEALFEAWHGVWLDPRFREWSIAASLSRVRAPLLAVQGSVDRYGGRGQLDAVVGAVAGARPLWIEGAGHAPHRDRPELVLRETARFLKEAL